MRFDANIAASGTISAPFGSFDNLTVSGQPVSTGTGGGGGSASDLQDAYDGGTGVITTAPSKPVTISGIDGFVADDGNIGRLTTNSGTFSQSLLYKGNEVAVLSDIVPTSPGEGTTVVSGAITRPLDLTYGPVALWKFDNDLVDEVSAITLTVNGAGTSQFAKPGGNDIVAAHLDGLTMFESSDASLLTTGDLTYEALIVNGADGVAGATQWICGWGGPTGDGNSANNFISRWSLSATNQQSYFAEEGTGSPNISYSSGYRGRVPGDSRTLTHVAMVRESNEIQFYVNGRPAGAKSSGLGATNDGSAGKFTISGNYEDGDHFTGMISCVKVFDKALTSAQILNEYERTLSFVDIPDSFVAASGTFTESLTISGVPVSTGTGGGGSASTLQEAYDNGDGVITTAAGKPLHISGDEYDGNVDFKVTGSGQFTESLQVGSGTTFITGDSITIDGFNVLTTADQTSTPDAGYSVWVADAPPDPDNMFLNDILHWSDEFDSNTLSSDWTIWDPSGNSTIVCSGTHGPGLYMRQDTSAGNTFAGVYTSVKYDATGYAIVTKVSLSGREVDNNKAGIFFAEDLDANPTTANLMALELTYANGGIELLLAEYTAYNGSPTGTTILWNLGSTDRIDHTSFYLKLVIAGGIAVPLLSSDGVGWVHMDKDAAGYGGASLSVPFTPVHYGLFINNENSGTASEALFPFFRIHHGNNSFFPTGRRLQLGSSLPELTGTASSTAKRCVISRPTGTQAIPHALTETVEWTNVVFDNAGWADLVTSGTVVTVPPGVHLVRVDAQISWDNEATQTEGRRRAMLLVKNFVTPYEGDVLPFTTESPQGIDGTVGVVRQQLSSLPIPVEPGDELALRVAQNDGVSLDIVGSVANWFSVTALDPPLTFDNITASSGTFTESLTISGTPVNIDFAPGWRGARVTTTSGSSAPVSNSNYFLPWDESLYDTDGFFSNSGDDVLFKVPAGVKKIKLSVGVHWDANGTGNRRVQFYKDPYGSAEFITGDNEQATPTIAHVQSLHSPVLEVVEGDLFAARVGQASGGSLDLNQSYSPHKQYFQIEVIDPVAFNPNDLTAVSGTFTESLTISGVPVSTGTGGGGSASSLQDAYDNDDGTITTVAGKPFHVVGDEYDGNVDFQVTGSGKFTEGLSVGSGTTFISGDVIETPSLIVDGTPISAGPSTTVSGVIARNLSTDHAPVALWNFDQSLVDSSGNGLDLSVINGQESYSNVNGVQGFKFTGDDTLGHAANAALEITGDVTIEILFSSDDLTSERELISYADQTLDTEVTNFLYGVRVRAGGGLRYDAEFGAGSNVTYTIEDGPSLGNLNHITLVRESADVTFYLNGYKIGASSSGLTAPTGGTSAKLNIGLQDGFGDELEGVICGLKIIPSALTPDQVFVECEQTWQLAPITTLTDTTVSGIIGKKLGTTHDPVALYLFDDNLSDSSGNGLDLTMNTGNERYTSINGLRAMKLSGAASARHNVTGTALEITGDITVQALLLKDNQTSTNYAVAYGVSGESTATNTLYSLRYLASSEQLAWYQEFGSGGTDQQLASAGAGTAALHLVTGVRSGSLVTLYIDGIEVGSTTLTVPTGGTSSKLNIGDFDGGSEFSGAMACVKIIDSALTADQVYAEYRSLWADAPSSSSGGGSSVDETQVALLSQVFGS